MGGYWSEPVIYDKQGKPAIPTQKEHGRKHLVHLQIINKVYTLKSTSEIPVAPTAIQRFRKKKR